MKQKHIDETSCYIEDICFDEIQKGMKILGKYIRNITQLISPILDISYNMQKKYGNINFKDVQTSSIGMWQSQICVNATTLIVHTEDDCIYTFIHVPNQQFKLSKKERQN